MTTNSIAYNRTLFLEDNLPVLRGLDSKSVDLIATDPPFNKGVGAFRGTTKAGQNVEFKDVWHWNDVQDEWLKELKEEHPSLFNMIQYANASVGLDEKGSSMGAFICWMAVRVLEMHRVLKDTGSMYLHCDPKASHYLKAMMDAIFGPKNFRNEIVWAYKGNSKPRFNYPQKHDIILFYAKGKESTFVPPLVPYAESTLRRYNHVDEAGRRYKISALRDGVQEKVYAADGTPVLDWWDDIPVIRSRKERTGWPTQKPLALYKRMIEASSNPGDIVLDPFAGCATTCVAAEQLERKWIGVDLDNEAGQVIVERLQREVNESMAWGTIVNVQNAAPTRTDDGAPAAPELILEPSSPNQPKMSKKEAKVKLLELDGDACLGCGWVPHHSDYLEVDHKQPKSKKGKDTLRNFGLLCGPCNSRKGAKYSLAELREIRIDEGRMDMKWYEREGKYK